MDGIGCGDLIIPKIRCYFYVNAPIYIFILIESSSIYTGFIGGKVELFTYDLPEHVNIQDRTLDFGEIQSLIYNHNENEFYFFSHFNIFYSPLLKRDSVKKMIGRNIEIDENDYKLVYEIPQRWALCACYIEDGIYAIAYPNTAGDNLIIRFFDSNKNSLIGLETIKDCGYANSICFRPQDRKLYIADSYTYATKQELKNTISVLDYDNMSKGIVDVITSPIMGGYIYSIAYDRESDTFYSTNYVGDTEGEANVLFSYNGVFESVRDSVSLDDLTVRNSPSYSQCGVTCVVNGVVYFVYNDPDKVIAGYDLESGEFKFAYKVSEYTKEDVEVGVLISIIYDPDKDLICLQTPSQMFNCDFLLN